VGGYFEHHWTKTLEIVCDVGIKDAPFIVGIF